MWGLGFGFHRASGVGLGVKAFQDVRLRAQGVGFEAQGFRLRVWDLGLKVIPKYAHPFIIKQDPAPPENEHSQKPTIVAEDE